MGQAGQGPSLPTKFFENYKDECTNKGLYSLQVNCMCVTKYRCRENSFVESLLGQYRSRDKQEPDLS